MLFKRVSTLNCPKFTKICPLLPILHSCSAFLKDVLTCIHTYIHKELVIVQNCSITIVCIRLLYYSKAFIQALSSTAVFFPKIKFFINLVLRIAVKCISNTLFDFKAYIVHR